MPRLAIILALVALLGACVTPPVKTTEQQNQTRSEYLLQRMTWTAQMSLLAMTPQEKLKARLQWQHSPAQYSIKLRDFIGRTVAIVEGDAHKVTAKTSKGQQYEHIDADHLLAELTGLNLPINGLKYWLQALADPNHQVDRLVMNEQGLPKIIQQAGWTIHYSAYQEIGLVAMASYITLDHDDIHLQLKISQWQLTNDGH